MSTKRIQVTEEREEEDYETYAKTLKKIMEAAPDSRGPAAAAIMSAFQVYFGMIGGAAARSSKLTR